jgi:uncharacterized protein (DUF2235 family)
VVNNYERGDEICCFGFSRGAYTARAVAGLLTQLGVIQPHCMDHFPALYRMYKANTTGVPFRQTPAFEEYMKHKAFSYSFLEDFDPPKIKVVGVWDTVGALGVPDIAGLDMEAWRREHGFHNTGLDPGASSAFPGILSSYSLPSLSD